MRILKKAPTLSNHEPNVPTWKKFQVLGTLSNDAISGVALSYVEYIKRSIADIDAAFSFYRKSIRQQAVQHIRQAYPDKNVDITLINAKSKELTVDSPNALKEARSRQAALDTLVEQEIHGNPQFKENSKQCTLNIQLSYLLDVSFIKRRLTKIAHSERLRHEALTRKIGADQENAYCSDETLRFIKRGDEKNECFLSKKFVIITETGESICLADIQKNKANNKYNETYFIIKNLEAISDENGFVPYMLTLTAPPEYHPNPGIGKCSFGVHSTTDSQIYLRTEWAKFRAFIAKSKYGIPMSLESCFGVRTAELHKDGCVHWHIILFISPALVENFKSALYKKFTDTQAKLELIKGSAAATYVQKYIIKTVNPKELEAAYSAKDIETDAVRKANDLSTISEGDRVRAGIRAMSIRQVEYYGVKSSLTTFRAINKITEPKESFNPLVAEIINDCRINDRHTKQKNLSAYKNFLQKHINSVELIYKDTVNKHGLTRKKIIGLRFIETQFEYQIEGKYEIRSACNFAKSQSLTGSKSEEISSTADAVTLISIYPSKKQKQNRKQKTRPRAEDLLKVAKLLNPIRYNARYIDTPQKFRENNVISIEEFLARMSI
jgi:hypothetical protein